MSEYLEGFAVIPRAIQRDPNIRWQEKAIYLALSSRVNAAQQCWPSLATIARDSGLSETTVKRARNWLRERGLLSWVPDPDGKPGSTVCIYTLGSPARGGASQAPGGASQAGGGGLTGPLMMQENDARKTDPSPLALVPEPAPAEPDGWAEFWQMYPRHSPGPSSAVVKKKYALALRSAADAATILAGLRRNVEWWAEQRTAKQHIPHATTWLNQERWAATDDGQALTGQAAGEWWQP